MPEVQESVYQDNGFELVTYRQRKADPFKTCTTCKRAVFPVASIYDEWQENQATLVEYFHCKRCKHILQETTRKRPDGTSTHHQVHQIPPYEFLVQLLAHARHIQGRGITRLTLNKRWWQVWRYPLVMGNQIAVRMPRVRAVGADGSALTDEQALHTAPLPRYQPIEAQRGNPFINRRSRQETMPDEELPTEAVNALDVPSDTTTAPKPEVSLPRATPVPMTPPPKPAEMTRDELRSEDVVVGDEDKNSQ